LIFYFWFWGFVDFCTVVGGEKEKKGRKKDSKITEKVFLNFFTQRKKERGKKFR